MDPAALLYLGCIQLHSFTWMDLAAHPYLALELVHPVPGVWLQQLWEPCLLSQPTSLPPHVGPTRKVNFILSHKKKKHLLPYITPQTAQIRLHQHQYYITAD